MNSYQMALTLEKEEEKLFRRLAAATRSFLLKKIFLLIVSDKIRHQIFLKDSDLNKELELISPGLDRVGDFFLSMIEDRKELELIRPHYAHCIRLRGIKQKIEDLYSQRAMRAEDKKTKDILLQLAQEKQRHGILIDQLTEQLSSGQ